MDRIQYARIELLVAFSEALGVLMDLFAHAENANREKALPLAARKKLGDTRKCQVVMNPYLEGCG